MYALNNTAFAWGFLCVLLCFGYTSSAQDSISNKRSRRDLRAVRITTPIVIDGQLDEEAWGLAPPASRFIISSPEPGAKSRLDTEIRVLYTDNALYVGARFFDPSPDSIRRSLTERDEIGNADWFGILIGPYDDGLNAVGFVLSAAGVQFDEKWTGYNTDDSWDMVWNSEARIDDLGWVAEIEIPFSALRFATVRDNEETSWAINFARSIRRTREESWWNFVDPEISGVVNQLGTLSGLKNIKSPVRLSLTPYVSGYFETLSDPDGATQTAWNFNGGLDLKYGLNDAFTLDMTLIPDFGQVQFDNQVLNLSPFEVRFDERRPFFMEGTELFSKAGLFYSRRVGARPIGYGGVADQLQEGEEIISNPSETRILNGTKVSGRTGGGLGIGVFNSLTASESAIITNKDGEERAIETSPLTNYNILVFDQNLKNDNSYITLTNTNVLRNGKWYDANVTGLRFNTRGKEGKYEFGSYGALSQKYYDGFSGPDLGHTMGIYFSKIQGNFTFETGYYEESDTYDPNDLGFLFNNNERAVYTGLNYNIYDPFWKLNRNFNSIGFDYQHLYTTFDESARSGTFQNFVLYGGHTFIWQNFQANGINYNIEPVITYDYFEPRIAGRFFEYPTNFTVSTWLSTDYRKKFAIDVNLNYRWFNDNRHTTNIAVSPRWRISDRTLLVIEGSRWDAPDYVGFATIQNEDDVIFGRRDQLVNELIVETNYIFSPKMWVNFRMRHYWSKVEYNSFHLLDPETGRLTDTEYMGVDANGNPLHDANFNAFTIDAGFNWRFAPGSDLTIVWKNGIFDFRDQAQPNYIDNLQRTFDAPQSNNISIKLVYYLDYVLVQKWLSSSN